MKKYAIFLLYQFKVIENNYSNKKRICEERIYNINASNAQDAYKKAEVLAYDEEFTYDDNNKNVNFEFVGIVDIVELSDLDDENLVWSRFVEKLTPMERKEKLIPKKNELTIFKSNKGKIKL